MNTIKKKYYVRGCRDKKSGGFGMWDGAYVICYELDKEIMTTYIYDNNKINMSNKYNFDESYKKYMELLNLGWKNMDKFDLEITTGIYRYDFM